MGTMVRNMGINRRTGRLGAALVLGVVAAVGVSGCSPAAAGQDSQEVAPAPAPTTVFYDGESPQNITVPAGATGVLIDAIGGGGGAGNNNTTPADKGSLGAEVKTTVPLPVKDGQTLVVSVGGAGQNWVYGANGGSGGWGGLDGHGGQGGPNVGDGGGGASGGGATVVQLQDPQSGALQTEVVAGGGGGGGTGLSLMSSDTQTCGGSGGNAGTNREADLVNGQFWVWQGSRGGSGLCEEPGDGGLAGVGTDPAYGGIGGTGQGDSAGAGGGGGGGYQGGYGGNGSKASGGGGGGGGAGSTAVSQQLAPNPSDVSVGPAPDQWLKEHGQVTLTWTS